MRSLMALTALFVVPLGTSIACSSSSMPSPDADASATDSGTGADTTSSDSGSDVVDSGPECKLARRFGSEVCEKCLRARCCTPIQTCEADPSCKALQDCAGACLLKPNPSPCIDKCKQDNTAGLSKYTAFDDCIAGDPDASMPGCAFDCSG